MSVLCYILVKREEGETYLSVCHPAAGFNLIKSKLVKSQIFINTFSNSGKVQTKIIYIFDKDHLIRVKPPVLKLLFEERSADVRWVVQLPSPVVVQDLGKYPRMPFKDVNLI